MVFTQYLTVILRFFYSTSLKWVSKKKTILRQSLSALSKHCKLHRTAFFKLFFQITSRRDHTSGWFFPADYEYPNHFFPARPGLSKFYVKSLKNHPKMLFFVSVNAEDSKHFQCYTCAECFWRNIFNAYIQLRAL